MKENWKQKKFKTWDEAFRGLTPVMRQQSVRVAEYTQLLFEGVCKSSSYIRSKETPVYAEVSYAEVAYKCGFYHQLGKALDPESYPGWKEDFTDEEKSRYCRYAVEGRELVSRLQNDRASESIPNKMIQEACELHMEHWDGSGFPYGYQGNEISLIAQIVGLAKEFDRLICERRSEDPYGEAVTAILAEEGRKFSENLVEVFGECQAELRAVYKKYIQYTKTMPKTVPLVEKRPERPFGLKYRQIVAGRDSAGFIYEAVPWFGVVLEQPEATESADELEAMLMRTGLIKDISYYFLYEAADALARIKNCELYTGGILVPMFAGFYTGENQCEKLKRLYEHTGIDKRKLLMTVPEEMIRKNEISNQYLAELVDVGAALVLTDYHPEELPAALVQELGFNHVRLSKDSMARADLGEMLQELQSRGIKVIDEPAGDGQLTEDELISYMLLVE